MHRLKQFLFVFYHNGTFILNKSIHGLSEIEGVWAEDGRFAKGGRFHHVGAAHWNEGTADENNSRERIEFSQVAHCVAENDRLDARYSILDTRFICSMVFYVAVADKIETRVFDKLSDFIESFRFSWYDYQPEVFELLLSD